MKGFIILNNEQEKAIDELKMRIKNDLTPAMREDSTIFYRFLKARDFDVDKAEKMLRKNISWRKTYQADTILQDFKPTKFFEDYAEPSLIGFDKDGDMVLYSPAGTFNIFDIFNSMKMNNFLKCFTWFAEKNIALLNEQNKKTGNSRYQATVIIDVDKLTFKNAASKLTLDLFFHFAHLYQDNYPERMKFFCIINAPSCFVYIYTGLKTMLAPSTLKKILIYQSEHWKECLLDLIDPDVLPAFLGGNRTDPDGNPLCRSFIKPGGRIPEKYFLTDKDRYFESCTKVTKIAMSKQEKREIEVDIERAGDLLQWEFLVKHKDIGFGIYFKRSETEMQEIIPIQRYDTSDGTEKDSYKCQRAGTYVIVFDNSYSWINSKTVEYSIKITKTTA